MRGIVWKKNLLHCEPSAKNSTMTSPRSTRTKTLSAIVISALPSTKLVNVKIYVGVVIRNNRIDWPSEMKETLNRKNVNLLIFVRRTAL